jgi:hypothetical protein
MGAKKLLILYGGFSMDKLKKLQELKVILDYDDIYSILQTIYKIDKNHILKNISISVLKGDKVEFTITEEVKNYITSTYNHYYQGLEGGWSIRNVNICNNLDNAEIIETGEESEKEKLELIIDRFDFNALMKSKNLHLKNINCKMYNGQVKIWLSEKQKVEVLQILKGYIDR